MTSWPCSASSAAATDESTPPDIATTIRMSTSRNHEATKHEARKPDVFSCRLVLSCFRGCRHADAFRVKPRSFSTSRGSTSTTRSTSSSVENSPRLKRSEFCVRCAGRPIARSTCDGSSVPDEQADPVDTAMPFEIERDQQALGLDAIEADVASCSARARRARR